MVQGQHWGGFRIGFSIRNVSAQLADTTRTIGLSLAAVLLLLTAIVVFIAARIAAPIRRVAGVAEQLALGDIEQRVDVRRNDEIGDMALAFESMIEYQQRMASAAQTIAEGDLVQEVSPASGRD